MWSTQLTLPAVSVADAKAQEGAAETLDFAVTLDAANRGRATVDYATADGTAAADEDYTATTGTLTFELGETAKTIAVTVLDDAVDEGEETFTLTLSNPVNETLGDAVATGTIVRTTIRCRRRGWRGSGRTVAGHVMDAVGARLSGSSDSHVTLAGYRLGGAAEPDGSERSPGRTRRLHASPPHAGSSRVVRHRSGSRLCRPARLCSRNHARSLGESGLVGYQ